MRPLGHRVVVDDIVTSLDIEKRYERIGLTAIIDQKERPRNTQGLVIAVGSDPLTQEEIKVGDIISFGYLSGTFIMVEGIQFRSLEFQEIINVDTPTPVVRNSLHLDSTDQRAEQAKRGPGVTDVLEGRTTHDREYNVEAAADQPTDGAGPK